MIVIVGKIDQFIQWSYFNVTGHCFNMNGKFLLQPEFFFNMIGQWKIRDIL